MFTTKIFLGLIALLPFLNKRKHILPLLFSLLLFHKFMLWSKANRYGRSNQDAVGRRLTIILGSYSLASNWLKIFFGSLYRNFEQSKYV